MADIAVFSRETAKSAREGWRAEVGTNLAKSVAKRLHLYGRPQCLDLLDRPLCRVPDDGV